VLKRTRPTENRRTGDRCVGSAGGPVTSGEGVFGGLLRKQSTEVTGGGTVQLEGEAKADGGVGTQTTLPHTPV
jgi:hypothetical protein